MIMSRAVVGAGPYKGVSYQLDKLQFDKYAQRCIGDRRTIERIARGGIPTNCNLNFPLLFSPFSWYNGLKW